MKLGFTTANQSDRFCLTICKKLRKSSNSVDELVLETDCLRLVTHRPASKEVFVLSTMQRVSS